tara:strand:- start:2863 stop:3606 length:744 start_codon:yes stop_codon:yes gene_type:complete
MGAENMSTEAQEALANTKLAGLRKKLNADSWNDNMENLMKMWGEKAAGLRYMHSAAGGSWKGFADKLSLASIFVTGIASSVSLVATSITDEDTKNGVLFAVGGVGLLSTLLQSIKKFYNAEEKSADHGAVAKQFGSFYRKMTLQLGMSREDREPADILSSWALSEYERLQQEAPNLGGSSVSLFKSKFDKSKQSFPDVAEDAFIINVFKPDVENDEDDEEEEVKKVISNKILSNQDIELAITSATTE